MSKLPHFLDNRLTDGGESVSFMRRLATLYPQEDSWYSLLLEAELTPGPQSAGRIRSIDKSSVLIRNQIRDLLACRIVPQTA
jgi:hypothetical protein